MTPKPYEIVPPAGIAGWHADIAELWRYVRAIAPGGGPPSRKAFDPVIKGWVAKSPRNAEVFKAMTAEIDKVRAGK